MPEDDELPFGLVPPPPVGLGTVPEGPLARELRLKLGMLEIGMDWTVRMQVLATRDMQRRRVVGCMITS